MIEWLQRTTFEAAGHWFGPTFGALASGFAVMIGLDLHLTPSGEQYLSKIPEQPQESAAC